MHRWNENVVPRLSIILCRAVAISAQAMKRAHSPEQQQRADIVRLNVGGRRFDTTSTSLMCPYFVPLLEGRFDHGRDEDGRVFIDRDGKLFSRLLNFMRNGKLSAPQSYISANKEALLDECAYFGLDWMAHRLRGEISPFDLRQQDRTMRDDELAGATRLLDVFSTDMSPRSPDELLCPLLPRTAEPPVLKTRNYEAFAAEFDALLGGWLSSLTDIKGLCFCGGSVIGTLTGVEVGDIDIFLTCEPAQAQGILTQIIALVQKAHKERYGGSAKLLITRSKHAVTIFQVVSDRPGAKPIQVILSCYKSVQDVLVNFDQDSCCFAFVPYEQMVYATPRGKRALVHGVNIVDGRFDGGSYTRRLEKYDRRGWRIGVPGLEASLISKDIVGTRCLYLQKYDLLVKAGAKDWHPKPAPMRLSKSSGHAYERVEVQIKPVCTQECESVGGVRRLFLMKFGLVEAVDEYLCMYSTKGKEGKVCLPLRGQTGQYTLLWVHREIGDDDEVEGYSGSSADCVNRLLEAHCDLRMSTDSPDFEWWNGGCMQKLSKKPLMQCLQTVHATVCANLQEKQHLLFLYDVISCGTVVNMKFVVDAARFPLDEDLTDAAFERKYGLNKTLQFKCAEPRMHVKTDWWSAIY